MGRRGDHPDPWLIAAAALFVFAALTDAVDGHLARKWRVVSVFGRIMDPFADKVLVLGAFAYLSAPLFSYAFTPEDSDLVRYQASGVSAWMVVLILARELLVTSIRAAFESRGVDFSATASGKWKMILQSVAVPLVLVILALGPAPPGSLARWAIDLTVWLTVIVTVWSGLPYIQRALRSRPAGDSETSEPNPQ
jgi:CDP-diacylglycerol--glycerol-3-phosphate 3-phosphatidyltransferase